MDPTATGSAESQQSVRPARGSRRARSDRGAEAFHVSPFQRLARTHALSVAGDTLLAIALADSLFFDVDPNDARWKVGAYLLLTIAPFAIVAPFLGPIMDRLQGGHRYMIIGTALVRAGLMAALARYVQDLYLFPLAFSMLVMGKTYAVAKSAVVPSLVRNPDMLVRSNSRLSVLSAVSGATAGVPGVLLLRFGGAPWVLGLGVVVFVGAAVMGLLIPSTKVATTPEPQAERSELRGSGILVASSAMGYLRGAVGFITMLLAFDLRGGIDPGPTSAGVELGHRVRELLGSERLDLTTGGAPPWHFGVALIGVGLGGIIGSLSVPRLRASLKEERILAYALIGLTAFALLSAIISTGLAGAFLMSFAIALAAQGGKQSFDSIVQRDAPRANLGRTFSRYESRFQLVWVLGALVPVVIPLPARIGYFIVAGTAAFVAATYWFGRTPNPAAIVSDGILSDGLDLLAARLPERMGRPLKERTWVRSETGDSAHHDDDPATSEATSNEGHRLGNSSASQSGQARKPSSDAPTQPIATKRRPKRSSQESAEPRKRPRREPSSRPADQISQQTGTEKPNRYDRTSKMVRQPKLPRPSADPDATTIWPDIDRDSKS